MEPNNKKQITAPLEVSLYLRSAEVLKKELPNFNEENQTDFEWLETIPHSKNIVYTLFSIKKQPRLEHCLLKVSQYQWQDFFDLGIVLAIMEAIQRREGVEEWQDFYNLSPPKTPRKDLLEDQEFIVNWSKPSILQKKMEDYNTTYGTNFQIKDCANDERGLYTLTASHFLPEDLFYLAYNTEIALNKVEKLEASFVFYVDNKIKENMPLISPTLLLLQEFGKNREHMRLLKEEVLDVPNFSTLIEIPKKYILGNFTRQYIEEETTSSQIQDWILNQREENPLIEGVCCTLSLNDIGLGCQRLNQALEEVLEKELSLSSLPEKIGVVKRGCYRVLTLSEFIDGSRFEPSDFEKGDEIPNKDPS
ncbi:hypothetical protein ETU10_08010 [Apibacter muscae]|uniref:hypothetical protein n=1 Tax=Apibacter muscae TaxID=2509004 RepID=UPI0011ADA873|nr:hypothetical protein [Apibacter muscae]TWP23286.1 hypothetical protein ETU10_08010 [Apibacter muscae]